MTQAFSAAAERNKDPILEVLRRHLPAHGTVLEIASGTGQHAVHFAAALPALRWQPSDPDTASRESIAARVEEARLENLRSPIELDVARLPWPVASADAIVCINMIHISPWASTLALFEGGAGLLSPGEVLATYGPYRRLGAHTAESNERFDADLRARNPEWGVRDMEAVTTVAHDAGFDLAEMVAMPANNFTLVFRRR